MARAVLAKHTYLPSLFLFTPTDFMRLANVLEIKYTIHKIILNQSKNLFYNKLVPQNKKINEEWIIHSLRLRLSMIWLQTAAYA
jgi:hypothetical protein